MSRKQRIAVIAAASIFIFILVWQAREITKPYEDKLQASMIVEYTDGSYSEPYTSPTGFLLQPLTIIDNSGKAMKSLRLELYADFDYEGNATGWAATGKLEWRIKEGTAVLNTITRNLAESGTTAPPKRQPFVISSATLTASDLESIRSGWIDGMTYRLQYDVSQFGATLSFESGNTLSKTLESNVYANWQFKFIGAESSESATEEFTSVSVTWNTKTYF